MKQLAWEAPVTSLTSSPALCASSAVVGCEASFTKPLSIVFTLRYCACRASLWMHRSNVTAAWRASMSIACRSVSPKPPCTLLEHWITPTTLPARVVIGTHDVVFTPEPGAQSISGLKRASWWGLLHAIGTLSCAHTPARPSHGKTLSCVPLPLSRNSSPPPPVCPGVCEPTRSRKKIWTCLQLVRALPASATRSRALPKLRSTDD
mmetsp:Transcript_41224/g.101175  ORF Transcript_41224/g.101175 Transcript_41224/m.101175 type:complete len:206 (-) Transcript_41224:253-870(-)